MNNSLNASTWDIANGGTGTLASIGLSVIEMNGYDSSGVATTFDTDYSIVNLTAYIDAAYTPQNSIYDGTAHDGGDVGAVSFSAGVAIPILMYHYTHNTGSGL